MTDSEFNEKYKKYLEHNHYGLSIGNEEFTNWLDEKFQVFITYPNFNYSQIKAKFNMGRCYCEGVSNAEITEIENKITYLLT